MNNKYSQLFLYHFLLLLALFGISLNGSGQGNAIKISGPPCIQENISINLKVDATDSILQFKLFENRKKDSLIISSIKTKDTTLTFSFTKSDSIFLELHTKIKSYYDTLKIHSSPNTNLVSDSTICGDSMVIYGGSFKKIKWSTGSEVDSLVVYKSGVYTLEVTDSNNCSAMDTSFIIIHDLPIVFLGNDSSYCEGPIPLFVGKFDSVKWDNFSTKSRRLVSKSGSYSVQVTNKHGCKNEDQINIIINGLPKIDLGPAITQCGDSVVIYANTDLTNSIRWNDHSTLDSLIIYKSSIISIQVTDTNGCINSDTLKIAINALPVPLLQKKMEQCGGYIDLDPGVFKDYLWNNSSKNRLRRVRKTENIWIEVKDSNDCSAKFHSQVIINNIPKPNLGNDITQCGDTVVLNPGIFKTYLWKDSSRNKSLNVTKSNDSLWVIITDSNNCVGADHIKITINDLPDSKFSINDPIQCLANNNFKYTSNDSNPNKLWYDGTSLLSTQNNIDTSYSAPGKHFIKLVTSNTYCKDSTIQEIDILNNSKPSIAKLVDTICFNEEYIIKKTSDSIALFSLNYQNKKSPIEYVLSDSLIHIELSDTGIVDLSITNIEGCSDTINTSFYVKHLPNIGRITSTIICSETDNFNLLLKFDKNNIDSLSINQNLSFDSLNQKDSLNHLMTLNSGKDTSISFTYYRNGCSIDSSINVYIHGLVKASIAPITDTIQEYDSFGNSIILHSAYNPIINEYLWSYKNLSSRKDIFEFTILDTGSYYAKLCVSNTDGCQDKDSILLRVNIPPAEIDSIVYIPAFFSPNNDGINDSLVIKGLNIVDQFHIYSLLGNKVFQNETKFDWWDGMLPNGNSAAVGSYLIVIEHRNQGKTEIVKQYFELLK